MSKFPYRLFSASISGGYHDGVSSSFRADTHFTGHHDLEERTIQGVFAAENAGGYAHRKNRLYAGTGSGNPERNEAWDLTFEDDAAKVAARAPGELATRWSNGPRTVYSMRNIKFSTASVPVPLVAEVSPIILASNYYEDYIQDLPGIYAHYTNTSGTWEEVTGIGPSPGTQISGTTAGTFTNSSGTTDFTGSVFGGNTGSLQGDGYEYNYGRQDGEYTEVGGVSDFNFVHEDREYTIAGWFVYRGPGDNANELFMGNTITTLNRGFYVGVENRAAAGQGDYSLRFLHCRGQAGVFASPLGGSGSVVPGKLHHFAITAEAGGVALYVDGLERDSGSLVAAAAGDAAYAVRFGGVPHTSDVYAPTSLYELSFASASWSAAEVLSAYSGGIGHHSYYDRVIKDLPGIASHWTEFSAVDGAPVDVGPLGLTASVVGTITARTGSVRRSAGAAESDGTTGGNFIELGATGSYDFTHDGSDYTIACWAKWDDWDNGSGQSVPVGSTITGLATRNGPSLLFSDASGSSLYNQARFFASYGATSVSFESAVERVRAGWHHLVMTRSGSLHSGYLDGQLVTGSASSAATAGSTDVAVAVMQGFGNGANLGFDGSVQEVTIASASWSADDVYAAYVSGAYNEQHGLGAQHMWPLASGYGGATDHIRGVSGTLVGTVAAGGYNADGQFGSYAMSGLDRVEIAAEQINIDWDSDFTVLSFVDIASTTNSDIWNNKSGGSISVGVSCITVTGVPWFRIHDNSGNGGQAVSSGGSVVASGPVLIACSHDRSNNLASIHVVESGKVLNSGYLDTSAVIAELSGSVDDFHIGYKFFSSTARDISNVSMYDRVLTANEILRLYEWYNPS